METRVRKLKESCKFSRNASGSSLIISKKRRVSRVANEFTLAYNHVEDAAS